MNAWVSLAPAGMAVLWLVLFIIFDDDDRSDTALTCANIWAAASVMIGVLR
jgi:hypothetical protein